MSVPAQAMQVAPFWPQAPLVDATQAPEASQQPAQLLGPHGVLHMPAVQVAPAPLQDAHGPPPAGPHAAGVVPGWQAPLASQHPVGQVLAHFDGGVQW
jgi:hypothetical protein